MESALPLYLIPLLPLLGGAANLLFGRKLHRDTVALIGCLAVGAAAVVAIYCIAVGLVPPWLDDHSVSTTLTDRVYTWLHTGDGFTVDLSFQLDALSAVMVLVVTFIGFFIHLYAAGYMGEDKDAARFFGYFNLFVGAMLVLVLGDSLPVAFIGWEGVGFSSFVLIGFWYDNSQNADAGRKAMVVNRIGDFAFLLGIFLAFALIGDLHFDAINRAAASGPLNLGAARGPLDMPWAFYLGLLFFIGACGKSAQLPLYVWLPDAMAGPTPVSALMHAATMVTAGVYVMCRLHLLVLQSPTLMAIVAIVGAATALFAATIAFAQNDLKKVLAYSTISQLGYMMLAVGVGAFGSAIFHLFTHAFFKGLLFLCAGSVMHALHGHTDMTEMGGLRKKMPLTAVTFLLGTLAIVGVPPFSGFFSKDELLGAAFSGGLRIAGWPPALGYALYAVGLVTAGCTAFYMFRAYLLTFEGELRTPDAHPHESPTSMALPLVVLAAGALFAGFVGLPGSHNLLHGWFEGLFQEPFAITKRLAGAPGQPASLVPFAESTLRDLALMAVAVVTAGVGAAIAFVLYRRGPSRRVASLVSSTPRLYETVHHKYYVDEAYDLLFVRPFRALARALALFDRFAIDTVAVQGSAYVVSLVGRVLRLIQNGDVQRYLAGLVVGAAAILRIPSTPPTRFEAQPDPFAPLVVHFDAGASAAGVERELRYQWDFEGDGKFTEPATSPRVDHTYPTPGLYTVHLRVTDLRWRRSAESSEKVQAFYPAPGNQPGAVGALEGGR